MIASLRGHNQTMFIHVYSILLFVSSRLAIMLHFDILKVAYLGGLLSSWVSACCKDTGLSACLHLAVVGLSKV